MEKITIKGTAYNAKLGAIIETSSGEVFYLEGLDEWPDDVLQKQVEATGLIKTEYHDPKNLVDENGAYKTGMSGDQVGLYEVKWKVLK